MDYTPMPDYKHLPADILAALKDYDRKVESGEIVFDSEGFAVHHPDPMGGWIETNLAMHLPVMDVEGSLCTGKR
jgi:hypothetical protein